MVQYLIEHDADIHADNDEAFCSSVREGHLEVAKYLVENGADIDAANEPVK